MKIAIVGMADFTEEIPDDFEIWVIAQYLSYFTKYDRAFECHEYDEPPNDTWKMFIDDPWVPFYVPEHYASIYPNAKTIPCKELSEKYFRSFGSTISYMLAQAIYEGADEISLYGVALCDEYEGQRPSAFYWLGVANGMGIKTSGLLTEEMYGRKNDDKY